jgi:hypothetical protein
LGRKGVLETMGNVEADAIIIEFLLQKLPQKWIDGGGASAYRSLDWWTVRQDRVEGEPGLENVLIRSLAEITCCHLKHCGDPSEVQIVNQAKLKTAVVVKK